MNGHFENRPEDVRREIELRLKTLRPDVNRETATRSDFEELRNLTLAREEEYRQVLESFRKAHSTTTATSPMAVALILAIVALAAIAAGAVYLLSRHQVPPGPAKPTGTVSETRQAEAREAGEHVGDVARVCGEVAQVSWLYRNEGSVNVTFINFDAAHPKHRRGGRV